MSLYHTDIYVPNIVGKQLPNQDIELKYSIHAIDECHSDKYDYIPILNIIEIDKAKVIEIETDENEKIIKIVYRINYYNCFDICISTIFSCFTIFSLIIIS